MHSRFRMKGLMLAAFALLIASMALPSPASAEPQPGARKKGFRLFARALGAMTINQIYCGLASDGRVCVDSTNSSTIGGGFWPKGTADQYVFNSGLQLAGIIGPDGGPWVGDTVGAFFFDPKGTTEHGEEVQPIFNISNPADAAIWPAAACVPSGTDPVAQLFDPLLQTDPTNTVITNCRRTASQGDVWFVSTEANPSLKGGRKHPLGVAVETRGMGWNFPVGNEGILYFIYTFYNISSTVRADYNATRTELADILYNRAVEFHSATTAQGVSLPSGGYTITNLFAAFAADMDVANAGSNYSGVNLPFALGYTYDHEFSGVTPGWTFDPSIFSAPFFAGAGFIGVKYLKSPTGPGAIQLFSNTINGGAFGDPGNTVQLYRYLSGAISVAAGDAPCNTGNPLVTHVCYVNNTSPADMRFFQSSTPLTLAPGQGGSIVVAYIFAAPVKTAGCAAGCDVLPGDALLLTDPVGLAATGTNLVDSISGFRGYSDLNSDGIVQQSEMTVVKGSLLGKSLVAQAVFDAKFLLPFAPDPPSFFLIPGDNVVTVIWKPTASETAGDPFFGLANQPTVGGNPNPLYDPNYRQFDVEGYRVYRGRVDAPNELTLLAQFDYTGTVITDYTGVINSSVDCAPEYAITTGCNAAFVPNLKDGTALTVGFDYDLNGQIIQINAGSGRVPLLAGTALTVKADSTVTGGGTNGGCGPRSVCPQLSNNGVPFVYVDATPRNNLRYFYSVTAFDVNSVESGPTSLESPRNTKPVTPAKPATDYVNSSSVAVQVIGRGVAMDTIITADPTINGVTGVFSGPARPANSLVPAFVGQLPKQVFATGGSFAVTLDSIGSGEADATGCCGGMGATVAPTTYYVTVSTNSGSTQLAIPIQLNANDDHTTSGNALFTAATVNGPLAQRYGGDSTFSLKGAAFDSIPSIYFIGAPVFGCRIKGGPIPPGNECIYNGHRWRDGPSAATSSPLPSARLTAETFADPNSGNCNFNGGNSPVCVAVDYNNAGALSGVTTVYNPQSYSQLIRRWRNMEVVMTQFFRAADINVYWGAAGAIDSVIDVTHNVPIAFSTEAGPTWGILQASNSATAGSSDTRATVLTANDLACVEPFFSRSSSPQAQYPCSTQYSFVNTVTAGNMAFYKNAQSAAVTAPVAAGNGFGLYLSGTFTMFEMASGLPPAAGTVWTMRSYAGMIRGGQGVGGGSTGLPYTFISALRPFTAVGAQVAVVYDVVNTSRAPTFADLKQVHTVPDPYYVTSQFEQSTDNKIIKFVNLPQRAIIRIYSSSGVLVNILEHNSVTFGGDETWNVRNRNNQVVASGVYFYHIEANGVSGGTARRVGRMTIVNFAQ